MLENRAIGRVSRLLVDAWDYAGTGGPGSKVPFMSLLYVSVALGAGAGAVVGLILGAPVSGAALGIPAGVLLAFGWLWLALASRRRRASPLPEQPDGVEGSAT